ncbi:hypothetical protein TWF694_003616 [Orbilia ellipsospora]|uniref:Uncharacterized protein n=1 Tax=Orbilia ellipsospora TaxID=2528407 RepID=A0AAV9WZY0_9PEZI
MKPYSHTTLLTLIFLNLQLHLTHAFYIWLVQQDQTPAIRKVYFERFYQCYLIRDRDAPSIGLAIYNAKGQTRFPGGIQLFQDPYVGSSCVGEPKTIITLAPRVGVTFINLAEMGLADRYTAWRVYEAQDDQYKLSQLPELQERGMSIRNKIFERNGGKWSFVDHLRDFPRFQGGYSDGYYERYTIGEGPDVRTQIFGRPQSVNNWIERQLKIWVNNAQGDGILRRERPAVEEEASDDVEEADIIEITAHKEPFKSTPPQQGSMDYVRQIAEASGLNTDPQIPYEQEGRASLPLFQRTLEILNGVERVDIPSPAFMYGQTFNAAQSMNPDAIQRELDILRDQPEGNELELGWALLRQAANHQRTQERIREPQLGNEVYDYEEEEKFSFDEQGEATERQYYYDYGQGMNMEEGLGDQDNGLLPIPDFGIQESNMNELQRGDRGNLRVRDMQDTPAIRIVEPMRSGKPTKHVYEGDNFDLALMGLRQLKQVPPPQMTRGNRRGGTDYDPFGDGRGLGGAIDDDAILEEHMRKMMDSDDSSNTYIGDQETVLDEGEPSPQMEEEVEPTDQMEAVEPEQLVERAASRTYPSNVNEGVEIESDANSYEPQRFIGYQSPQAYSDVSERNRMMEFERDFMNRDSRGNSVDGQAGDIQEEALPPLHFSLLDSPESHRLPAIPDDIPDIGGILDIQALLDGVMDGVDLQNTGQMESHPSTESELSDLEGE